MTRRLFLTATGLGMAQGAAQPGFLMLADEEVAWMRRALERDAGRTGVLRKLAGEAMKKGPWSVTAHRPANAETAVGANDYYSDAPYWWPDPKDPKAPFIRKDGERNPQRFERNRRDLGDMAEAVLALGIGAGLLGDARCGARAADVLRVWFVDTKTRMNPHLEYGQAIRGRNTGRGAGIIDTVSLIYCLQGAALAGVPAELQRELQQWFGAYARWLTTSKPGTDEMKAGNNHATWWTAQVAAYGTYCGDAGLKSLAWKRYREWLVPSQVEPDGSCPKEEARTKSLSYSSMNLDGFSVLCRLGDRAGERMWGYESGKKTGVKKACHYLAPYVVEPGRWKKQQISGYEQDRSFFLGLAGLGMNDRVLLEAYGKLPRAVTPWVQLVDVLVRSAG